MVSGGRREGEVYDTVNKEVDFFLVTNCSLIEVIERDNYIDNNCTLGNVKIFHNKDNL